MQNPKIIVTGASQGLGKEIALSLLKTGAAVSICARSAPDLAKTESELRRACPDACLLACPCDVSRAEEINAFVARSVQHMGGLDGIVLNAGIYGPMGPTATVDLQEWTQAMEINLFGVLLPARAVIPIFQRQRHGRIVMVSGGGATKALPNISAYSASKTAAVRLAECLALELEEDNIQVNSVAPGALNTRLVDQVLAAGPEQIGESFYQQNLAWKKNGATSPQLACQLILWLLGPQCPAKLSGRLLSAPWDSWQQLPDQEVILQNPDIYRLRRIVPSDRGIHDDPQ